MLFRIMLCSKGFVGLIAGGLIPTQEMTPVNESVGFEPAARKVLIYGLAGLNRVILLGLNRIRKNKLATGSGSIPADCFIYF